MAAQARGLKVGSAVDPANPRFVELGDGRALCFE